MAGPPNKARSGSVSGMPGTSQEFRRATITGPRLTGVKPVAILPPTFDEAEESLASTAVMAQFKQKPVSDVLVQGRIALVNTIHGSVDVLCLKYSETFEELAAGCADGIVRLYVPGTPNLIRELGFKSSNTCTVTGINHRVARKAGSSQNSITCTCTIVAYQLQFWVPALQDTGKIRDVDGSVKAWNCKTGVCIYSVNENRQVLGISYHNQFPKFATVGDDGRVLLYDEETKTQERVFQASNTKHDVMDGHKSRVFSSCFNPKFSHELISGGWDDTVQFWDMRQPHAIRHLSGVHMCGDGIDINSTGNEILTCSWQKMHPMQIWDYGSGKLIASLEPDAFNSVLYCGKWVSKEVLSAGGAEPNVVRFVNQRTMMSLGTVQNMAGAVYSIDEGGLSAKAKAKAKAPPKKFTDMPTMPRIAFCSGKNVYEIEPA